MDYKSSDLHQRSLVRRTGWFDLMVSMSNKRAGLEEPIVVESSGELAGRGLLPVEVPGSKSRAGECPSEAERSLEYPK